MALLNAEDWIDHFDLEYMTLVMSAYDVPEVEVLLVSGGVRTEYDLFKLRRAVGKANQVIAVGTCAISGGIANLGERPEVNEIFLANTERLHLPDLLPTCRPIDTEVKVDLYLPGCPPTPELFMAVLDESAEMEIAKSVCQECGLKKARDMRGNMPDQPGIFMCRNINSRRLPGDMYAGWLSMCGLPGPIRRFH
jgi:F420-non-reducing hydrogenase small subunit